jgi:predicted nucleotidyltransferase
MSDNNKKNKDIEGFEIMEAIANPNPNDLQELLEWMASPQVYWENFEATVSIKKPSEIKWFALRIAEA